MIIEIIANTPKWVWLILIALTVYGKYLSKDQLVHEKMLFILPFVMIYMGLSGISSAFSETLLASTIWLSGIVLSCTLLYFLKLPAIGQYNIKDKAFKIFGSWVPYMIMLAIFCTKYVIGVATAMQLPLLETALFVSIISFLYGTFSGVFIYRTFSLLSLKKRETVNLT